MACFRDALPAPPSCACAGRWHGKGKAKAQCHEELETQPPAHRAHMRLASPPPSQHICPSSRGIASTLTPVALHGTLPLTPPLSCSSQRPSCDSVSPYCRAWRHLGAERCRNGQPRSDCGEASEGHFRVWRPAFKLSHRELGAGGWRCSGVPRCGWIAAGLRRHFACQATPQHP